MDIISFVINLVIIIVVFAILFKLLELALSLLGISFTPQIKTIFLILFLIVLLYEFLALVGFASPHYLIYHSQHL